MTRMFIDALDQLTAIESELDQVVVDVAVIAFNRSMIAIRDSKDNTTMMENLGRNVKRFYNIYSRYKAKESNERMSKQEFEAKLKSLSDLMLKVLDS